MVLDTNALSAAADADPAIIALLARADQVAIPVIALGEYRYGIVQSRHRASFAKWLNAYSTIAFCWTPMSNRALLRRDRPRIEAKGEANSHH